MQSNVVAFVSFVFLHFNINSEFVYMFGLTFDRPPRYKWTRQFNGILPNIWSLSSITNFICFSFVFFLFLFLIIEAFFSLKHSKWLIRHVNCSAIDLIVNNLLLCNTSTSTLLIDCNKIDLFNMGPVFELCYGVSSISLQNLWSTEYSESERYRKTQRHFSRFFFFSSLVKHFPISCDLLITKYINSLLRV